MSDVNKGNRFKSKSRADVNNESLSIVNVCKVAGELHPMYVFLLHLEIQKNKYNHRDPKKDAHSPIKSYGIESTTIFGTHLLIITVHLVVIAFVLCSGIQNGGYPLNNLEHISLMLAVSIIC
eukprot:594877_1